MASAALTLCPGDRGGRHELHQEWMSIINGQIVQFESLTHSKDKLWVTPGRKGKDYTLCSAAIIAVIPYTAKVIVHF